MREGRREGGNRNNERDRQENYWRRTGLGLGPNPFLEGKQHSCPILCARPFCTVSTYSEMGAIWAPLKHQRGNKSDTQGADSPRSAWPAGALPHTAMTPVCHDGTRPQPKTQDLKEIQWFVWPPKELPQRCLLLHL